MFKISFVTFIAIITLIDTLEAAQKTIVGTVTMGSSAGLIHDEKSEYAFDGRTQNLKTLMKGCPLNMGEEVPCKVRFEYRGGAAIKIISAVAPEVKWKPIQRLGSVVGLLCERIDLVGYDEKMGCILSDDWSVNVLAYSNEVAKVKSNGQIKYAITSNVLINCDGTNVSLDSFIGKNFPPGMKRC